MANDASILCPTCKQRGAWLTQVYGPFCSQRCKWVDLGKWFSEQRVISEPLRPDHFEGYGELPPGDYLDDPGQDPYSRGGG